jgi:hypothetical protein
MEGLVMSSEPDLNITRRGPRPASDEAVDSAEVPQAAKIAPRPVGRPRREKAEPVIQFSTRLGLSYREAIDAVEAHTGETIREIIEQAIRVAYPDHYKAKPTKQR